MADQRDVLEKLIERIRESILTNGENLAANVTKSYNDVMDQAVTDLQMLYDRTFKGGQLNYSDYRRLKIDDLQMRMLRPYLGELQKRTVDSLDHALQNMYLESYRRNAWALDQTTPLSTTIKTMPNLTANPATDFYLSTFLKQQIYVPWKGAMFSQRLGVINDKMARNIQSLMDAGMVNGWSTDDLSLAIRREVGIAPDAKLKTRPRASSAKMRADMISRTEMMRSADLAKQYLFDQNKKLVKDERWQTSDLGNVCDDCDENDGELFSALGLRPPLHPRCACTGIPVLASWGELLGPEYAGMKDMGVDEFEMKYFDPSKGGKLVTARVQPYDEWLGDQAA